MLWIWIHPFLRLILEFHLLEMQRFYFLAWLKTVSLNALVKQYILTSFSSEREASCWPSVPAELLGSDTPFSQLSFAPPAFSTLLFHASSPRFRRFRVKQMLPFFSPQTPMTLETANESLPMYMRKIFVQILEKFSRLHHQHDTSHSQ